MSRFVCLYASFKRNILSTGITLSLFSRQTVNHQQFRHQATMDLTFITKEFEKIAPLKLAASWDNVGLLIEPTDEKLVSKILFTNDLTMKVLDEAVQSSADMIYSYHPPIFASFKRLKKTSWKDRIILSCIENRIAIYSPHTALDAACKGVNDWLINCFDLSSTEVLEQSMDFCTKYSHQIECQLNTEDLEEIKNISGLSIIHQSAGDTLSNVKILSDENAIFALMHYLSKQGLTPLSVVKCEKMPLLNYGMGRIGKLSRSIQIQEAISIVKSHVNVDHIRVSFGKNHDLESMISSVAVCAGSGASLLRNADAELYVTGEMSHHELLDAAHRGVTTILCEHSNSERGFLKNLIEMLKPNLLGVKLQLSEKDLDPIVIM